MLLFHFLLLATGLQPASGGQTAYRQPQIAVDHGKVAMTFGSGGSIYFAASPDGGTSFAAPVKVADTAALALGRHRGPRLAILKNTMAISAVVCVASAGQGDLLTWRSLDDGTTWQPGGRINDVANSAREGLHAMAALPDGGLFAAWLDLRQKGMRLYSARSADGGVTWSKNTLVYESPDGTICQCCHPSLAVEPNGRITVMFRNALGGSRDLYAVTSTGGVFSAAEKQGQGTWKLDACPMDGGAIIVNNGLATSAWRRGSDIFLAEAGQPERRIGPGKDVTLAQTPAGTFLAYTQEGGVWALLPAGRAPVRVALEGAFPVLAALPSGGVLAAWESKSGLEWTTLR